MRIRGYVLSLAILAVLFSTGCGRLLNPAEERGDGNWIKLTVKNLAGESQTVWAQSFMGGYLVEGDMFFAPKTNTQGFIHNLELRWGRLWPAGVLVYEYSEDLSREQKEIFRQAIDHIASLTPIRFRQRSNEEGYLLVISDDDNSACWSAVAYTGQQELLDINCGRSGIPRLGTVVHEVLHALGFRHEHSRPDRDEYVRINWQNIRPDQKRWFEKWGFNSSVIGAYDYASVMHYGAYAFSKNGQPTIIPIGLPLEAIGNREGLSPGDVSALKELYGRPWVRIRTHPVWGYIASNRPQPSFSLENAGAEELTIEGVATGGWIREASVGSKRLGPGEETSLEIIPVTCQKAGFQIGEITLRYSLLGAEKSYRQTRGVWLTCYDRSNPTIVKLQRLQEPQFLLTFADAGWATEFEVSATVAERSVAVTPTHLSLDHSSPVNTAMLKIPAATTAGEVCVGLKPLNSNIANSKTVVDCLP